jgi:hypothetical protein
VRRTNSRSAGFTSNCASRRSWLPTRLTARSSWRPTRPCANRRPPLLRDQTLASSRGAAAAIASTPRSSRIFPSTRQIWQASVDALLSSCLRRMARALAVVVL